MGVELPEHAARPYSVNQLAARWDCSPSMIRKLIGQNRLKPFRIGELIRISAAEVERYECQDQPTTTPTPSSDSEEDTPSSGATQATEQSLDGATAANSPRKIGRAPRRRPAPFGSGPTIVPGPWGAS